MQIDQLFSDSSSEAILKRAGIATKGKIALHAIEQGKNAVILATSEQEAQQIQALLVLLSPKYSSANFSAELAVWDYPFVKMPVYSTRIKNFWASCLSSLYALTFPQPHCVVLSCECALLRHVPKSFFETHCLTLHLGEEISPESIVSQLIQWGYERTEMVSKVGDISKRGDILDIFPSGYAKPVRLEFFGDTVDSIRIFNIETQRSLTSVQKITCLPVLAYDISSRLLENASLHWDDLHKRDVIDENLCYSLKKEAENGNGYIFPGILDQDATNFEQWLSPDTVWILPDKIEAEDSIREGQKKLSEKMEAIPEIGNQPQKLVFRTENDEMPWHSFFTVHESSLYGNDQGIDLPEHSIKTFVEMFPSAQAKDRPWQEMILHLKKWQNSYDQVILSFETEQKRKKFLALSEEDGIKPHLCYSPSTTGLFALISPFREGAKLLWKNMLILGEEILFPSAKKAERSSAQRFKGLDKFTGIKIGDLLVHRDYGIGRFQGLQHISLNNTANDFLLIEYAGNDKLYVPADRLSLIQRYKGNEDEAPFLDRLGGNGWLSGKEKAKKAIEKIAADLLETYAFRKIAKGFRYNPPGDLYREFEATFAFEETPDQAKAIEDVIADMDKDEPMDRLICGDVGFGKTEVAMRAAFRAASDGRQAALLCPTTVLAEQHYHTFSSRLSGFPINIALLSRFVSKSKQQEVLDAVAKGKVDILIGTHRILSKDVHLPNLALLILDEEQRFGVRHKEKLKSLKKNVDVLTLTATPIPRTLQLSMSGIRELSIIETAPLERKPVATTIIRREAEVLRGAIKNELQRSGQVFWVCNRVTGLERTAEYVQNLVPEARVAIGHGQMKETELEKNIHDFWHGKIDILVCTTIVESGLDFPYANTIIIDQAHMFGLSQLYQLRGRVGRSDRQAYAYFIVPEGKLPQIAEERLRLICDFDYLGAGFQIAMEDLRLRGAGNILGEVQSGHIGRIGIDLYLEMLEETVAKLKGNPHIGHGETELTIGIPAHIPEAYIPDGHARLGFYKSLTSADSGKEREDIVLGLRDRYGTLPVELDNFLKILSFKDLLSSLYAEHADIFSDHIKITWKNGQVAIAPEKVLSLINSSPNMRLIPPSTLLFQSNADLTFDKFLDDVTEKVASLKT